MFGNYKEKYDELKNMYFALRKDFNKLQQENDKLFRENSNISSDLKSTQEQLDERETEIAYLKNEIEKLKEDEMTYEMKYNPTKYDGTKRVQILLSKGESITTYLNYSDLVELADRTVKSDANIQHYWMTFDYYDWQNLKIGEAILFTEKIDAIRVYDNEDEQ